MAVIGTIKEVSTKDGQHLAIIETGSGPAVTATIMQGGGVDFQPIRGDRVIYHEAGQEIVVSAIFSEDAQTGAGEWLVFSRDGEGAIKSTVHLKADGEIHAFNDGGFYKLESNGQFNSNGNFTVDP